MSSLSDPSLNPNARWGFSKLYFVHWLVSLNLLEYFNPLEGQVRDSSNSEQVLPGVDHDVGHTGAGCVGDSQGLDERELLAVLAKHKGTKGGMSSSPPFDGSRYQVSEVPMPDLALVIGHLVDGDYHTSVQYEGLHRRVVVQILLDHDTLGCGLCDRSGVEVGSITQGRDLGLGVTVLYREDETWRTWGTASCE